MWCNDNNNVSLSSSPLNRMRQSPILSSLCSFKCSLLRLERLFTPTRLVPARLVPALLATASKRSCSRYWLSFRDGARKSIRSDSGRRGMERAKQDQRSWRKHRHSKPLALWWTSLCRCRPQDYSSATSQRQCWRCRCNW